MAGTLKLLSKLRRYDDKTKVETYLTTEMRQNFKAVEDAFRSMGKIGEYLEAVETVNPVDFEFSSDPSGDAFLELTPGDWDVNLVVFVTRNGATITDSPIAWIGDQKGRNASGRLAGTNLAKAETLTADFWTLSVSGYRKQITETTKIYVKVRAAYSVATPQYFYRLSARRLG